MDLEIDKLLAELGYRGGAASTARLALEAAKLTTSRKQRIAESKRGQVASLLAARFARACAGATCQAAAAAAGRELVPVEAAGDCEFCGGSRNEEALDRAAQAMLAAGMRRLLIVGGSPNSHREVRDAIGGRIELKLIEGVEKRRTGKDAKQQVDWADLVVIWGGTQLDHKVSTLYTGLRSPKVVTATKRSAQALAETIVEALRRRGGAG